MLAILIVYLLGFVLSLGFNRMALPGLNKNFYIRLIKSPGILES